MGHGALELWPANTPLSRRLTQEGLPFCPLNILVKFLVDSVPEKLQSDGNSLWVARLPEKDHSHSSNTVVVDRDCS